MDNGSSGREHPLLMKAVFKVCGTAGLWATLTSPADPCLLPMDEGSCGKYTMRWYFNRQAQACRPFIYSGCEGNDNRFLHLEECEETCLGEADGTNRSKTQTH
uniref:BPTI/Kunitz inhibitor domain-containing protein n=1 Tax=Pundamilia nyererei TaxID=303518 RepID=A0A3B4FDQ6_9CICH